MRLTIAGVLVGLSGLISLSYEIFWFRVFAFASGGAAPAFSLLLGAYLLGIAVGSRAAARYCKGHGAFQREQLRVVAQFILVSNIAGFFSVPVCAWLFTVGGQWMPLAVVALVAAALGAQLPLISHYGVDPDELAGAKLSYLYGSNIVGSVAGSLLTGFVFMDHFSMATTATVLTCVGVLLSLVVYVMSAAPERRRVAWTQAGAATAVAVALLLSLGGLAYGGIYERLQYRTEYEGQRFKHIIETKSGVITVTQDDQVFGGGMYDGVFNVELVADRNGLIRPFTLSLLHPAPKHILMIGLASGSWATVVANHPGVERLTVIEINPGYVELIRLYPQHAKLLSDPKVEIIFDDGRRYLNRNPDAKYDAVISNTTWHWRSQISNILSVEFHQMVRAHLKPGGVFLFNTTSSQRAMKAAFEVFPHGMRINNNLWVSDQPIVIDRARWEATLKGFTVYGAPLFDLSQSEHSKRLQEILALPDALDLPDAAARAEASMEWRASLLPRLADVVPITDDNMGHEWWRW